MATHILTWFSNKNEENWKFIAAANSFKFLGFRFSRQSWEVRQVLLSRMDHTEKSKGFRSGLLEGQSSLLMNAGMWAWIHRWVILEPCEGAESCWNVQGAPSKCSRAHGNSSPSKMSEMYRWLFNFTSEGTKTKGDLPVAVTDAQTITEVGFWRLLTLLPSTDAFLPQTRSFWWLTHCSTSNFFSSENTKLGSMPSSMRFRRCRHLFDPYSFMRGCELMALLRLVGEGLEVLLKDIFHSDIFSNICRV